LIRLKLALTENDPIIKPFDEVSWAELEDSKNMPIAPSLKMIEGTHARWTVLLNQLTESDYNRSFIHPNHNNKIRIDEIHSDVCLAFQSSFSTYHKNKRAKPLDTILKHKYEQVNILTNDYRISFSNSK
jgi:hypothetical protein